MMFFHMNKNTFLITILTCLTVSNYLLAAESIPSSVQATQSAVFKVENNDGSVYGSGFFVEDNRTFVTTFDLVYQLVNLKDSSGLSSIFVTKDNKKFQIKSIKEISPLYNIVFLEVEAYNGDFLKFPRYSIFYKNNEAYTMGFIADELSVLKWTQILAESKKEVSFIGSHTNSIRGSEGGPVLNRYGEIVGMHGSSFQIEEQDIPNIVKVKHLRSLLNQSVVSENNRLAVKEQFQKSLKDLESLAQRDMEAQFVLANILLEMNHITKALSWFRKSTEQGFALAQYKLAIMLYKGMGAPVNKIQALSWFHKSAEQRMVLAQYNLGIMFSNGDGVPEDKKQAVDWLRPAAEKGISSAQYHLGSILYVGFEGVPQDKAEAVHWYRQSAEQGHANAQYNLATILFNGDGIPQDKKQAVDWYRQSAEQGFMEAQHSLALVMRDNGNRAKALFWFRKVVEPGSIETRYDLALLLLNEGKGTVQERQEALFLLTEAAQKDFIPAQYELGRELYRRANTAEQRTKALSWLKAAAEKGHTDAQKQVERLSKKHIQYLHKCRDVFRGMFHR